MPGAPGTTPTVDRPYDGGARPGEAIVSVYARGRDYHKVLRARLQKLMDTLVKSAEAGEWARV